MGVLGIIIFFGIVFYIIGMSFSKSVKWFSEFGDEEKKYEKATKYQEDVIKSVTEQQLKIARKMVEENKRKENK